MRRFLPLILVLGACAGSGSDEGETRPYSIPNQGGDLEGHGPRGFAGQGVGLFAGDELNSSFPADDGIQIWLTFELPPLDALDGAVLRSDALTVRGNPFDSLGELRVEQVDHAAFEPGSFDLAATSDLGACSADVDAGTFECDVTDIVAGAAVVGDDVVQFRLKFDQLSDGDGEPDLALFFLTDSNTNEPGIFTLDIS